MALHNIGRSKQAVELLLTVLAEASSDAQIQSYREAILFYAQDIERSWSASQSLLRSWTAPRVKCQAAAIHCALATKGVLCHLPCASTLPVRQ